MNITSILISRTILKNMYFTGETTLRKNPSRNWPGWRPNPGLLHERQNWYLYPTASQYKTDWIWSEIRQVSGIIKYFQIRLLYLIDEINNPVVTLKTIGTLNCYPIWLKAIYYYLNYNIFILKPFSTDFVFVKDLIIKIIDYMIFHGDV